MSTKAVADQHYETINGRKIIKKHVATIHCANKLSLLERKISNALLFNAYPTLRDTLVHEVSLEKLKRLLNANTRNHKPIKQALKKLISTVIEWNILGDSVPELDDIEGWNASTILSSVSVVRGTVKYQYSELMKGLIIDPKIYGKINLIIQSRFKSSYALALYENCARYRGLKYTKDFDYDLFRKLMGVEEDKYPLFRDFNRRVLSAAVAEINTCSDIFITPQITRRGRKVTSIKFKLEERPIKKRLGEQLPEEAVVSAENEQITQVCRAFQMTPSSLQKFITQYGEERVARAIKYVKSRPKYHEGRILNPAGYLKTVIEKSYDIGISPIPVANQKKSQSDVGQGPTINATEAQEQYRKYMAAAVKDIFDTFSPDAKEKLEAAFVNGDHPYFGGYAPQFYEASGIDNILMFEAGFADYLLTKHADLMPKLKSFEQFKVELMR